MQKSLQGELHLRTHAFISFSLLSESARITANTTPPYPAGPARGRWQISGIMNGRKTRSRESSSASLLNKITPRRTHGETALAVKSSNNMKKSSRKANWTKSKKRAAKFEAMKPKKPPTAFFYFLEDFRKEYQEQNPDVKSMQDIGKACGQKWKTMTYEGKVHYYDAATQKRAEFDRAMADYVKRKESGMFKQQTMQTYMDESLTPLDDGTIPSEPSSEEVNSMFNMVVGGPKKGRMYGCGSMASTIYPDEMAPRPRGGSRKESQDTKKMREEWETQKKVNEHLRIDLQAIQNENASLKDRMTILEDQVRRLVAGLPQPQPQPSRRFLYGRGSSSRGRASAGSYHFDDSYAIGSSHRSRSGKAPMFSSEYVSPSHDFGHDDGDGDSDDAYDDDETQSP